MEYVWEIERSVDVNSLVIGGVQAWPVLRLYAGLWLLYRLEEQHAGFSSAVPCPDDNGLQSHLIRAGLSVLSNSLPQRQAFHNRMDRDGNAFALLFSDSNYCDMVGGVWYDRFCDPIIEELKESGRGFRLLERLAHRHLKRPRNSESFCVNHVLVARGAAGMIRSASTPVDPASRDAYDSACRLWSSFDLPLAFPSLRWLVRTMGLIGSMADYFEREIVGCGARIGITICYYSLVGLAFVLACRRQRIPSVDVQHGLQTGDHTAYVPWLSLPSAGYDFLPSMFWCWTEIDSQAINAWATPAVARHHAITGGNLWHEYSHRVLAKRPAGLNRKRIVSTDGPQPRVEILASLQPHPTDILPLIEKAMEQSPADCKWWLRLHPKMRTNISAYQDLASRFSDRVWVSVEEATETPLPLLLSHIDLHITGNSSVVFECAEYGIPSIITDEFRASSFKAPIEEGLAVLATTPEEVAESVRKRLSSINGRAASPVRIPSFRTQEAMQHLYDAASH